MQREIDQLVPASRRDGLVVQELSNEVLVYDRERNNAHCLNRTAALVWSHCDGKSSVAEIARAIAEETNELIDEDVIWLGVEQLSKRRLLQGSVMSPVRNAGLSRRELIRRIGLTAAVALPVVTSIIAPTAAQAANCLSPGAGCSSPAQCCSQLCNVSTCA